MNWPAVGTFTFQGLLLGLLAGLSSWQIHPASGWKEHVSMGAVSTLTYVIGKLQISPLPNGLGEAKKLLALVPFLGGCAGFGVNSMSPEQLAQWAKNKDATCTKITGVYMGATINAISVSVDKGIPPGAGAVSIDDNCKTTITAEPRTPATIRMVP